MQNGHVQVKGGLSRSKPYAGGVRAMPVFAWYTLKFALQLRKKHGKTSQSC
jgi:hypothetical protein